MNTPHLIVKAPFCFEQVLRFSAKEKPKFSLFTKLMVLWTLLVSISPLYVAQARQIMERAQIEAAPLRSVCYFPAALKFKMGEHVFTIPAAQLHDLLLTAYNIPSNTNDITCDKSGVLSLQVIGFSFFPGMKSLYKRGEVDETAWDTSLHLEAGIQETDQKKETFDKVEKILSQRKILLKELPVEEGFYVLRPHPGKVFYIITDSELITFYQKPVAFECSYPPGRELCETRFSREGILFGASNFSLKQFPVRHWRRFYGLLQLYIDELQS